MIVEKLGKRYGENYTQYVETVWIKMKRCIVDILSSQKKL